MSYSYDRVSYHDRHNRQRSPTLSERSRQEYEDQYRYRQPPMHERIEEYTVSIALIEDVGPDVIENVVPGWGLVLSPINDAGLSTLYTIESTENPDSDSHLIVYETLLIHRESTLRAGARVVTQLYKIADIDNSAVPRRTLHNFITAFSPNRSGSFSPIDEDWDETAWTSAHWVFRTLYFMGTTGHTFADSAEDLQPGEQRLCSKRVVLPCVVNVMGSPYVKYRGLDNLEDLKDRIYHTWMFHGKYWPVVPGPVPVYILP